MFDQTALKLFETFPVSSHIFDWTPKLLLLLSAPELNHGIFTNFSHEPTWRWYFAMTPFEAFFLGIIITQFGVLNMLGIFPLNLSALINGMANGRRKREVFQVSQRKRDIASQLLKLMKKLDPDQCSFKSICELEAYSSLPILTSSNHTKLPQSISGILSGLKQITKKREAGELYFGSNSESYESLKELEIPGINKEEDDVIALYEEAIKIGDSTGTIQEQESTLNAISPCEKKYPRCPVDRNEILGYVEMMESIDDLLQF